MRSPSPALVVVLVVVASAGCLAPPPEADAAPEGRHETAHAAAEAVWANFTGRATAVPVAAETIDFPVEVPQGAVEVQATLTWTSALADLRLFLVDPSGGDQGRGFPETETRRSAATLDPPASGTWTVRVVANRALDEPFTVATRVLLLVPQHNVLEDTVPVGGTSLFQEINVIMEEGAEFAWSFEAGGDVHYDIHSHEDGKTTYHERGTASEGAGVFVAPKRQIYSLLFAPPEFGEGDPTPAPVQVSYRMEGAFRVHSHSQ